MLPTPITLANLTLRPFLESDISYWHRWDTRARMKRGEEIDTKRFVWLRG